MLGSNQRLSRVKAEVINLSLLMKDGRKQDEVL
jgi:hypothetical protein